MLSLPAQKELLSGPCGDHIDGLFNVHNTGGYRTLFRLTVLLCSSSTDMWSWAAWRITPEGRKAFDHRALGSEKVAAYWNTAGTI